LPVVSTRALVDAAFHGKSGVAVIDADHSRPFGREGEAW
jgi:hypothetical protein